MKITHFARKEDFPEEKKAWRIVDAKGVVLGKLAVQVANALRGKDKVFYTPHVDIGDYIVVINASEVKLTGKKETDKIYYHHTGYIGHLKSATAEEMRKKSPEEMIKLAVSGMLPKNKLKDRFLKKLKVFAGEEHTHAAQMPTKMEIN